MAGNFGDHGGQWVAETLMPVVLEVQKAWESAKADPTYWEELQEWFQHLGGRPTPLYRCDRLSPENGATIWLKREDLVHGGAHKFNNVMGQMLLAKRMGRTTIIAETGAGQHGVATSMAGAVLGLQVRVYMGAKDVERQALNVFRMKLHGAEVIPVHTGSSTLKDAVNAAMRAWSADPEAYYCIGSVVGPHPFPEMVRDLQSVIGKESRAQCLDRMGRLPERILACVGGGSNAMGMFHPFLGDKDVELIGVEAGGKGVETQEHASVFQDPKPGILHGSHSYLYQDEDGQIQEPHSISAGLDYPAIGPEHAFLFDAGMASYTSATDQEALDATLELSRKEGILPALESAHAVAAALRMAKDMPKGSNLLVNLSGRGDKDVTTLRSLLEDA